MVEEERIADNNNGAFLPFTTFSIADWFII
jgi:hypothetical protein